MPGSARRPRKVEVLFEPEVEVSMDFREELAERKRKRKLYPKREPASRGLKVFAWCFLLATLYVVVAAARWRFMHPELTETELFLELGKVIAWAA